MNISLAIYLVLGIIIGFTLSIEYIVKELEYIQEGKWRQPILGFILGVLFWPFIVIYVVGKLLNKLLMKIGLKLRDKIRKNF